VASAGLRGSGYADSDSLDFSDHLPDSAEQEEARRTSRGLTSLPGKEGVDHEETHHATSVGAHDGFWSRHGDISAR